MRFCLIDRIVDLVPGEKITAQKHLSLAEEYLADHFPRAPVMPGVMMLEALVQSSAWLIRVSDDFAHSMVTLKEARGVKYANFVEPGRVLLVTAEITAHGEGETKLKAQGTVDGTLSVSAKLVMQQSNLADERPEKAAVDAFTIERLRRLYALLRPLEDAPVA